MHIRHIPLYALAAGALAVSVLLFGDGDGADAATDGATDAVAGAVTDAVAEAAPAAGSSSHAVVVQPDPVAPGTAFSVYDGGNCSGDTAEATFDSADIPTMQLSTLSDQVGGTAIMPEGTAPGSYTVTVTCGGRAGAEQSHAAYDDESGDPYSARDVNQEAGDHGDDHGKDRGSDHGDGSKTYTGTVVVSGDADEIVPQGGSRTGLGGAAGTGPAATTLGGVLLMGAAGWGALAHRRRARGTRS
ncbi:hypothetical protein ACH4SK_35130 [Streptomyces inhibens]|uniref:hypothetical protein n=1 Tax=Streptomyces inhibens TaxID=2293571 RepID=UPI003791BF7E